MNSFFISKWFFIFMGILYFLLLYVHLFFDMSIPLSFWYRSSPLLLIILIFYSLEIDKNTGIAQKMKAAYFTPSALVNIDCTSATTSIEDLKKVAQSAIYQCVAIDSFNKIQNISQKDFEILRKSYPNIIWIVVFQSTTGKVVRGGNMPEYDSSVVIQVNKGGFAIQEKNRYGNTDKTYSVFLQKIVEQK